MTNDSRLFARAHVIDKRREIEEVVAKRLVNKMNAMIEAAREDAKAKQRTEGETIKAYWEFKEEHPELITESLKHLYEESVARMAEQQIIEEMLDDMERNNNIAYFSKAK